MNYRRFYQDKLGIVLEKSYHVHHIDSNRNNNNIVNLVALPKSLHLMYHSKKAKYEFIISLINECNYFFSCEHKKYFNAIKEFMDIKNEVAQYIINRDNTLYNKSK